MKAKTRNILIGIGVLAIIGAIGQAIESKKTDTKKEVTEKNEFNDTTIYSNQLDKMIIEKKEISNWNYSESKDPMTEKVRYFAHCQSKNKFNFDFPYDGGSYLTITVRKMNGINEVILSISKGQFLGPYNSNVKIKFDDGPIKTYSFNDAADGSSDYIFLNGASGIIQKLRTAKKVKIEPEFYQEGQTVFEFDVDGFKWQY